MRRLLASAAIAGSLVTGYCAIPASAATSPTRRQLASVLPEVKFDGVALAESLDFLRDVSGANITVNWKALEEAGVTRDTPINIRLRHVSLKKAMEMVLSEAGGG